jgi:hypothetical protein
MSKERYSHIIDEVFKKYADSHWTPPENPDGPLLSGKLWSLKPIQHSKETFINECKTDKEFSERWGLKIEERGLTYKERWFLKYNETFEEWADKNWKNGDLIIPRCSLEDEWTEQGIPTKLITVTYNNETIEIYE